MIVVTLVGLAITFVLCIVLSALSYYFKLLTKSGALASFVIGMAIGVLGSISWLILLILFAVLGFAVTKFKMAFKKEMGVQEGRKGERTYKNVVANSLVPLIFAIGAFLLGEDYYELMAIAYIAAISVAASDTVASEIGNVSKKVVLITTGKEVEAGIDGGVSIEGTAACIAGGFLAAYIGWAVIFSELWNPLFLILGAIGVLGCMIDSVIGATLERRGLVSKFGTNMISMAAGSLVALAIWML